MSVVGTIYSLFHVNIIKNNKNNHKNKIWQNEPGRRINDVFDFWFDKIIPKLSPKRSIEVSDRSYSKNGLSVYMTQAFVAI